MAQFPCALGDLAFEAPLLLLHLAPVFVQADIHLRQRMQQAADVLLGSHLVRCDNLAAGDTIGDGGCLAKRSGQAQDHAANKNTANTTLSKVAVRTIQFCRFAPSIA